MKKQKVRPEIMEGIKARIRDFNNRHAGDETAIYYVDKLYLAMVLNTDERMIRRAFSELRKEMIIFIPERNALRSGIYLLHKDGVTDDQLAGYVKERLSSLRTEYFNDVVRFLGVLKDQTLINDIKQIQMDWKEE